MTLTPDTPVASPTSLAGSCDEATVRKIANRLRRARGQLDAVITAVESGGECREVLTQLAAVRKALNRAGFVIVSATMSNCLVSQSNSHDDAGADAPVSHALGGDAAEQALVELEKLILLLS